MKNENKNAIVSIATSLFGIFLTLAVRKVFVSTLPNEFLGLNELFGSIIVVLSLVDVGIETVMPYRLYKAIASKDKAKIKNSVAVCKKLCQITSTLVFISGAGVMFFLNAFTGTTEKTIYLAYIVSLSSACINYLFLYYRLLIQAQQKEYVKILGEALPRYACNVLQILLINLTGNYLVYVLIEMLCSISQNLTYRYYCHKNYSKLLDGKASFKELINSGVGEDYKNCSIHRISTVVNENMVSLLTSSLVSVNVLGFYSNLVFVSTHVNSFFTKLCNCIVAKIGEYVNTNNERKNTKLLIKTNQIFAYLSLIVFVSYYLLLNPFIKIVFGEQYMMDNSTIFIFSLTQFILWLFMPITLFRKTFGRYEIDKWFLLLSSIASAAIGLLVSKNYGLNGVLFGYMIGQVILHIGNVKAVNKIYRFQINKYAMNILATLVLSVSFGLGVGKILSHFGFIVRLTLGECFALLLIGVVCILQKLKIDFIKKR